MADRRDDWLQFVAERTTSFEEFAKDPRGFLERAAALGGELTITLDDKPAFVVQDADSYIALFDRAMAAEKLSGTLGDQLTELWDKEQEDVAAGTLERVR